MLLSLLVAFACLEARSGFAGITGACRALMRRSTMEQNGDGQNRRSRWATVASAVAVGVLSGATRAVVIWLLDHFPFG